MTFRVYLWGRGWALFNCPVWGWGKRVQMHETFYCFGPMRLRISNKR